MQPTRNQKAVLDTIAFSEIGPALLADPRTDNGYKVIVGSTPAHPILMTSYATHPHRLVQISARLQSTAAGRYQLLARYFDTYSRLLGLKDFSPASQDAIALQQIKERGALADIEAGNFRAALARIANIWASLPGAGYGQRENELVALEQAYTQAGGTLA